MSESVVSEVANEALTTPQPLGTLDSLTEFRSRRDEAPAEVVETVEKPVVEAEKVEAEPDPASEAGKALAAKKGSLQSRIDQLTREKNEAVDRERKRIFELEAKIAAIEKSVTDRRTPETAQEVVDPNDPEPLVEKFDSYEKYVKAQARWEARQEVKAAQQQYAQRAQSSELERRQESVRAKALEAHPDSDDVLQAFVDAGQVFHPAVSAAVLHEELGHEIAYAVAKDPALHAKIAQSPNPMVEIGRLIGRLEGAKEAPKAAVVVSKAPEPVKPVSGEGSSASGGFDPGKSNSIAEFRKNREKL
jgi:hypothetical protein